MFMGWKLSIRFGSCIITNYKRKIKTVPICCEREESISTHHWIQHKISGEWAAANQSASREIAYQTEAEKKK